jgi:ABC-type multidrug transport system fused ATPase/permease subunit
MYIRIWGLLTKGERDRLFYLLILMSIGMILETMGVGLVIPALVLLTREDFSTQYPFLGELSQHVLNGANHNIFVIYGMLFLVFIYLIKAIFLAYLAWQQSKFSYGVQVNLSKKLFTTYLLQPYTFHLQRNSAQLIRNATNEVAMFRDTLILGISLIAECLVVVGLCSLLFIIEPKGAAIVLFTLAIAGMVFQKFTRKLISQWGVARHYHDGLRIQYLQEGLGGAKDVKLLAKEDYFINEYDKHNIQSGRVGQLQSTVTQLPRLWLETLAIAGLALLVTSMLLQGRQLSDVVPTLGLFAAAAFRLMPSVNRIIGALQGLRFGQAVIDTLYNEIQLAVNLRDISDQASQKLKFENSIELKNITFTYPEAPLPTIKDVSLKISCGECVGFVGTSGSGKSTLIDILLGLLPVENGGIYVDGQNIVPNMSSWQKNIGYVPQSIFLTDNTLAKNIAFGLSDEQINEASLWRAVKSAQLDGWVKTLPQGLSTTVGERGIRLSGGQRQRIGIARALYHDPSVLVLDEATSALDVVTEQEVMDAVEQLHGSKTIVIITHRLSTVSHCDRVYEINGGRLV